MMTFALSFTAHAKKKPADPNNPPIKAGTEITVTNFNPRFQIFLVKTNAEPGIGPNYAHAKDLHKALDHEGSLASFIKNKDKLLGSIFTLSKDLAMVDLSELAKAHKEEIMREIKAQKSGN